MGKVPPIDEERNQKLIADYTSKKMKPRDIWRKYEISKGRMYEILGQYNVKTHRSRK